MRLTEKQIRGLRCELCKDDDAGFIIYPNKDKHLIKWDCGHLFGHLLYRDGTLVIQKIVNKRISPKTTEDKSS